MEVFDRRRLGGSSRSRSISPQVLVLPLVDDKRPHLSVPTGPRTPCVTVPGLSIIPGGVFCVSCVSFYRDRSPVHESFSLCRSLSTLDPVRKVRSPAAPRKISLTTVEQHASYTS